MHLLPTDARSLDEAKAAVDLGQSPADIVFLSFSDADLALVAAASKLRPTGAPSLRLAHLDLLGHPYSVDLYVANVASKARFVLVRLLGGMDYWRYGVEELALAACRDGFMLAVVPGDTSEDHRLDEASTLPVPELRRIAASFRDGTIENITAMLDRVVARIKGRAVEPAKATATIPVAGRFEAGCRRVEPPKGEALILFYRSFLLADDTEPIIALADTLAARGLGVTTLYVSSLKEKDCATFVEAEILRGRPDIVLNTTGFSARHDDAHSILDLADAPVLQVVLAGLTKAQWRADPRGLRAADLAMNVVLPEMDGRLVTRAISCKEDAAHRVDLEFTPRLHKPLPSRVAFVADLARAWVKLRTTPRRDRKIACILSDYPAKGGRTGYAVGLDTPRSVIAIADFLREAGYDIGSLPDEGALMRHLEEGASTQTLTLDDYAAALAAMPVSFVEKVRAHWGEPEGDPLAAASGGFVFSVLRAGNLWLAVQPCRGKASDHKADYHNAALPPRPAYIAFYAWLRRRVGIDAIIHCGTHGTLEWLPGKAVALDEDCAPEVVLGPVPVIYPFIVNNPGEAAQAKRRIAALTIGHLTPPLTRAGSHGAAIEIEALLDEYAAAERLDPRRAKLLASAILDRAGETGLLRDSGAAVDADPQVQLQRLDAFLCDVKDMRIHDSLHVFGRSPEGVLRTQTLSCFEQPSASGPGDPGPAAGDLLDQCGAAERDALLAALDGRFVAPGPGGAPSRGRLDVLPTGRNIYGTDPRAVPTRTAYEIGRRAAREVVTRHAQDRGEWPERIVLDLWASATMRTGGDDLAQALALLGVAPTWDTTSARVSGFEILAPALLDFPRVDVTLRISGLFRDVFPAQIALFDQAVRAVAELDEDEDTNPLAAARRSGEDVLRVFGAAPGTYGVGLSRAIEAAPSISREDLGAVYLAATSFAYSGGGAEGSPTEAFADRVASADALVHVQDQDGADCLDSDAVVDHVGGFAAAAALLGGRPAIYHLDATRPDRPAPRALAEEIARTVRARAANPRWIKGMMRHGHRGAAEIAEAVDHLYGLAVLTDAVESRHFDLLFEATIGTSEVRAFLVEANPRAARAIAERFDQAAARGLWRSRRNSAHACLATMLESPA